MLSVDSHGYAGNLGDDEGDDLSNMSPAVLEFRILSIEAILRAVNKPFERVVKVLPRNFELGEKDHHEISGYVTMARFLQGATPQQFEKMLGFKERFLQNGVYILYVLPSDLSKTNISPRYYTSWSAGISPRDLENLSTENKKAGYHPDYPAATDPVPQFVIHRNQKAKARLVKVLNYKEQFEQI